MHIDIYKAFNHPTFAGLGLGATVAECDAARMVAAGYDYANRTDAERKAAAALFNTECIGTVAETMVGARRIIDAGDGDAEPVRYASKEQNASAWLRANRRPSPNDYNNNDGIVPASNCGPLDSDCVRCNNQKLAYNIKLRKSNKNRYYQARCFYDCMLNAARGSRKDCSTCNSQYPVGGYGSPPSCAGQYQGGYVSPSMTIDETGAIVQDDSKAWHPDDQVQYQSQPQPQQTPLSIPVDQNGSGSQPGVVDTPESQSVTDRIRAGWGGNGPESGGQIVGEGPGVPGFVGDFMSSVEESTGISSGILLALAAGAVVMVMVSKD